MVMMMMMSFVRVAVLYVVSSGPSDWGYREAKTPVPSICIALQL